MKYITFAVPAYNSEAYLERCIDTLLPFVFDAEIVIINDGSSDQTLNIAKKYQNKYPNDIVIIDKENGGHGSGVNEGLAHAKGLYYKVIDSDDWIDIEAFNVLLNQIKAHVAEGQEADLYFTNFTYNHFEDQTYFVRDYNRNFPKDQFFDWTKTKKKFKYSATILMHALYYKTSVLRKSKINLPHHTFYVDNIFVFEPLSYASKLFYLDISVYQYFIGRADQSITQENICKNYKQQIRVMKHMIQSYKLSDIEVMPIGLKRYMKHHLTAMMIITQMFTVSRYSDERKKDLDELWVFIKNSDSQMYKFLRYKGYNTAVNFLSFKLKKFVMVKGYRVIRKKVKLG